MFISPTITIWNVSCSLLLGREMRGRQKTYCYCLYYDEANKPIAVLISNNSTVFQTWRSSLASPRIYIILFVLNKTFVRPTQHCWPPRLKKLPVAVFWIKSYSCLMSAWLPCTLLPSNTHCLQFDTTKRQPFFTLTLMDLASDKNERQLTATTHILRPRFSLLPHARWKAYKSWQAIKKLTNGLLYMFKSNLCLLNSLPLYFLSFSLNGL